MTLLKKIVATQKSGKKKYIALALISILAGVSSYFYIEDKKTFDHTVWKISSLLNDFSKFLTPYYVPADKPFSYESAEFDPKVMGDPNKMYESQQKEYEKYLASKKNTATDRQVKKYLVRKGDDAQVIADTFGISIPELKKANPNVDWGNLKKGQKLNVFLIAGGPAGSPEAYSEKIPQAYANKKVNKTTKAKKTKPASEKSKQMAELQKEKEKTEQKKETVETVIDQKNSKEAKTNPQETKKQIKQTIDQSTLSNKEKAAVKQMANQKNQNELIEAKKTLEKKEEVLNKAIENNDPQIYLKHPPESFDLTIPSNQRHEAFYLYQLLSKHENGTYNIGRIDDGVRYFLSKSGMVNNLTSDFHYFGIRKTSKDVFQVLKKLYEDRESTHMNDNNIYNLYRQHWARWQEAFPEEKPVQK